MNRSITAQQSDESTASPDIREIFGRGQLHTKSILLKDYVSHSAQNENKPSHEISSPDLGLSQTVSDTTPYPISSYVTDQIFSVKHQAFMSALIHDDALKSYHEAAKLKIWGDAMHKEVDAFEITNTWDVTTLPPGIKENSWKQMVIL